jgi:hypothetical protein
METDDPKIFKRVLKAMLAALVCLPLLTSCNKDKQYIHWMQQKRFVIQTVHGQQINEWCDCHIKLNNVPSRRDSINCYTPSGDTLNEYDLGYKKLLKTAALTK